MIIYKTTNLINGKSYVGQDSKTNPDYFGSGLLIMRAIKKYGVENFVKEIVAWCDTKDKLDFMEKFYIDFYNSKVPNGYNLTDGGRGVLGFNPSLDQRKRNSEAIKEKWKDSVYRKNLSEAHIGKYPTEEAKAKMSAAHKGEKNHFYGCKHSEETIKIMSDLKIGKKGIGMTGKHHIEKNKENFRLFREGKTYVEIYGEDKAEECKKKLSAAQKIYQNRPEVKAKKSASMNGHIVTAETKAKIAISHIGKKHSEDAKNKMRETKARNKMLREILV